MKRFVNFFTCFIFIILFLGMSVSNIFAFSAGPPDGRTGSPADGGLTCNTAGCHDSFGLNTGTLTFSITAPGNYTLGSAHNVTVSFNNTSSGKLGFELSALDANNNPVGSFTAVDANTQVSGNYIKHTTAGNNQSANANWLVQWTAPSTGVTDPVTFYAAGNEADGSADPTGDHIYTATALTSVVGTSINPSPDIKANGTDGPVTLGTSGTLKVSVSLNAGGSTSPADFWVYATIPGGATFYLNSALNWVPATPIQPTLQGTLPDFGSVNVLDSSTLGVTLPPGDYVFTFSVDGNMDGVKDDTFKDTVSVTIRELSFKKDIAPLFTGNSAWFNYGGSDSSVGTPATACGACHAGDDGVEPEVCPPECHLLDLNTAAGWLAGSDGGSEPILGESSVGATDYNWGESGLRKRLRNNRMPPGFPFIMDGTNRLGGDVDTSDDGNDIDLGGAKFFVNVTGTSGRGEVEYGGANNAIGLLSAYVAVLGGTPTTYAGAVGDVVFADIAGLFSKANVWFNGGLACTACHYCAEVPPCFHKIDFSTEAGLLAGSDGGEEPLLGESSVGATDYNWGESGLRARLRNNRMPPDAPFDPNQLTRNGPNLTHPLTGASVRAVDLIGEWVANGAKDN